MDKLITHARGFATLEIIIALAIVSLALSAVILVSFGSQFVLVDNQTSSEALTKAQEVLELARAASHTDFKLLNPTTQTDGMYTKSLAVSSPDFFQKKVDATVSWQTGSRLQHVTLTELIANLGAADKSDTCDSNPSGDWTHPYVVNSTTDFGTLVGDVASKYSISDVEAYWNRLYVGVDKTSTPNTLPTLFIFDITDPTHLTLLGKIDTSPTTVGVNALTIASSSMGAFVYVANAVSSSNFATCTQAANCAQLQIFNVQSPASLPPPINYKIPGVTGDGNGFGQSIFYANGYVYLGLNTTTSGPEFNIVDVHNPTNPQWVGGYSFGYPVNAIFVKDSYAYVAHTTSNAASIQEQLTVLDVHDPTHPVRTGGFFNTAGSPLNGGKAVTVVGDTVYVGRYASKITPLTSHDTIPEFYALGSSLSGSIPATPLGSLALPTPKSIHGLVIRNSLAFFVTTSHFEVWDISDLAHITQSALLTLQTTTGGTPPSIDCEKNVFYVGSNDSTGRGFLSIITAP